MEDDYEFPAVSKIEEEEEYEEEYEEEEYEEYEDLSILKVGQEKEIGQNGLKKKLVKAGGGWTVPCDEFEVEVHYTGTLLDGTKVDSTRDRGTPLKFKLGFDQVIEGLYEGIETMKKGENAIFTIPPELAYGESGSPPTIPPNATLQFDVELLSLTYEIDIFKDGGILKKVLVEGEGCQKPTDLDEIFVKYEACLEDGTLISKSDGVEFTAEDGFCPALRMAVKTMEKDEKVWLTVKPQYAFGEDGRAATDSECAVPPNATLNILLELVSWKSIVDVSEDRKVLKKILKEGEDYNRPCDGYVVQVKLIGKLSDGTVFMRKGHDEPFEFKIDEEQVIDGLDKTVKTMKIGENALVTIQPEYAFGSCESKQELAAVPANSTVYYEVEMVSWQEETFFGKSAPQKIEFSRKKIEEGDILFKAGKYERALRRYEKALRYIHLDYFFSDDERKQTKLLKATCNFNKCELCTKMLELDSTNVEALYGRAQANIHLVNLDLAEADIKRALEIDPDNSDVELEYRILKDLIKEYNEKDAQFHGNTFVKTNKVEQAKAAA